VTILKEVVANLLVGEGLESFGDIYPFVIDRLNGNVLLGILASFVGM